MPLRRIVLPLLTEFTQQFGETSLLTVLDRSELKVFFSAKAETSAPMRYVIETNTLVPLGWGGVRTRHLGLYDRGGNCRGDPPR